MESSKFPLDIFPKEFKEFVETFQKTNNFPIDFTAISMMYATSLAIGNTIRVRVKNSYEINASLWFVFVARSGSLKSPPIKTILKPFREVDRIHKNEYDLKLKEFEEYERKTQEEKEECFEAIEKPVRMKHLFTDFTSEKIISRMSENLRGIGVFSDEIKMWLNNLNRYSSGGDQEMWLSFYDGTEYDYDRVKGDCFVDMPFGSIIGGMTTLDFKEMYNGKLSGNGLWERFNVCVLNNLKKKYTEEEVPQELLDNWKKFIFKTLTQLQVPLDELGRPEPVKAIYTKEAIETLKKWTVINYAKTELECHEFASLYSKQEAHLHKFALCLHIMSVHCESGEVLYSIGKRTLQRAIKLVDYFENNHIELKKKDIIKKALKQLGNEQERLLWYAKLNKQFKEEEAFELYYDLKCMDRDEKDYTRSMKRWFKKEELFEKVTKKMYRKTYDIYEEDLT